MRFFRHFWYQIALMTCFIVADQVSKAIFAVLGGHSFDLVGSFLRVEPSLNRGLAFSVPLWSWAALLINLGVLGALIWYWLGRMEARESWWLAVVIGGAFGNLVDRLFLGGVHDWFVINWGFSLSSINLADLFVMIGAIGWLWEFGRGKGPSETLKDGES